MKSAAQFLGIIALAAVIGLSMMGCEEPGNTDNTPEPTSSGDITYTVARADGVDGKTNTTGIVFTFSASVDSLNLSAADITVGGTAAKGATALSGTGTTRTLAITVNSAGTATITIAKTGIEAGTKHLTVYKAGEIAPALTGITAVYNGTTAIYPTTPLNNLKANLTVKAQYSNGGEYTLSEHEYSLSGTLTIGTSTVTVTYTDGVTKTTTFTVTVTASSSNKTLTGITLNTASVKKDYYWYEQLNLSGLVVTANYSDSTSAAVTGYTTDPVNSSTLTTAGTITVTVSYTEGAVTRNNTFTITVIDPAIGTPGLEFVLINNGTAYSVRKGSVSSGAVYIPTVHNGLPVTEIGSADDNYGYGAFYETNITSVYIPESVTTIGGIAFSYCTSLTGIIIPESVTEIGGGAFNDCTSLRDIIIDTDKVTSYWNTTFNYSRNWGEIFRATNLSVTFKKNVGDYAFSNCDRLVSVTFGEGVTSIGERAFQNCTSLSSVTLGEDVTSIIGNDAFSNCTSLINIIIDTDQVTSYGSGNQTFPTSNNNWGTIFLANNLSVTFKKNIGNNAFYNCTRLTSVTIDEGVTSIGNSAFSYCTGLTGITIPEGVTAIGQSAFNSCTGITEITIPASVTSVGNNAFYNWTASQTIYVEGYANQAETDAAWGSDWRSNCNAVIVYSLPVSKIEVTQQPNKTVYLTGSQLDISGLVVTATYSNGTTETVTVVASEITGFNTVTAGTKTLTISYRGKTATFTVTVVSDITVTNAAQWDDALAFLNGKTGSCNIIISGSFSVARSVAGSTAASFGTTANGSTLTVTLKGNGTLSIDSNRGNILRMDNRQTLIIDSENLILQGSSSNYTSLVYIEAGATLELRNGAIIGNRHQDTSAGSPYSTGGGVFVVNGTFIMSGGTISGNSTYAPNSSTAYSRGGGVCFSYGTFIMNGGTISGNKAITIATNQSAEGGGVYIGNGTFTMNGGTISGNEAVSNASGNGNGEGGGVFVYGNNGTFTMNGGTISGNTATRTGTGNSFGGGVCVSGATFRIVTGTIYGSNEADINLRNTALDCAAFYAPSAQRGTFNGETWVSMGTLGNSVNTVRVVNGQLQ